jgi:cellulose synthase (UDP-forming)
MKDRYNNSKYSDKVIPVMAILAVVGFGFWWFNPIHIPHNFGETSKVFDYILFFLVSYVIWHPIIMDVVTWCISSNIKYTPHKKAFPGLRVAFVTTIVPANESLNLLHKCLPAMVDADYEHDTWLLDEANNAEVKAICEEYGVKHFSRFGNNKYNTIDGKFAKKTKGGNHNSWYDMYGNNYDVVAQIDTDFVPKSTFLTSTLGYFKDPKVAFVGTPQIYGNTHQSMIAKGAAQQQYSFYGSILRGLSAMDTSLLIGANHVIRVRALKEVNHYSAHITEDLLTGMKLHTKGWKSIYLSEALAIGEGPLTWEAYFNQQMRWAYGCIDILFRYSFSLYRKMGLRRMIYYFFLQQHYFSGIAMALSIVLLSLYFFVGISTMNVDIVSFFIYYPSILVVCWLMSLWLQRYHVEPLLEKGLLLAGKIISIAAWPIYFLAFASALSQKRLTYKVTPKGDKSYKRTSTSYLFLPHMIFGLLALFGLLSSFFTHRENIIMLFWAANASFLMFTIPFSQNILNAFIKLQDFFTQFRYFMNDTSTTEKPISNSYQL